MKTFYDFVCAMPSQSDKAINTFVSMCKVDELFPKTNDTAKLACYLYLKLDEQATGAFQKLLMLYCQMHPERLPKRALAREDMALSTINLIVSLQNASAEYKWH